MIMKTALLIINYGTPEKPEKKYVKKYLRQLLNSKHIMTTLNALGRNILVNCIIIPARIKHSLSVYKKLNSKYGMLLQKITDEFASKVQTVLSEKADVYTGMTAGYNYLKDVLEKICAKNYRRLIVAPMYPQYTESTWGKALDDVYGFFKGRFNIPIISTIDNFYDKEPYLNSMKQLFERELQNFDYEKIVFSYHGIPKKHPGSQDYVFQCSETTRLICQKMGISLDKVITSYQSRISEGWLEPYTDLAVMNLAESGVKKIAVLAPSFTVDCLETVIELGEGLREKFLKSGGESFKLIPCLNAEDFWIKDFCKIAEKWL